MKSRFYFIFILIIVACNRNNKKEDELENNKTITDTIECDLRKVLESLLDTDTITFDIGTQLFWKYNCDSVWLTYINQNHEKVILDNWVEMPEFVVKLGLYYLQDYKNKILFQRNIISGCCDLPDNLIFDKKTGREIINIGPKIWYSKNKKYPLIICFDNSDLLKDRVSVQFEKLIIYNLDNDRNYYFDLSKYSFFKDLKEQYFNYSTNLLEDYIIRENILILQFRKENLHKERDFIEYAIKLNLDDYMK